jgi:tRNA A-37 threonylcarbamoyl transferase component Bud32
VIRVCDRYESVWRAGGRPRIEDFLEGTPETERPMLLHELIALELEIRRDRGETPTPEEYHPRFPDDSDLIHAVFGETTSRDAVRAPGRGPVALPERSGPTGSKRGVGKVGSLSGRGWPAILARLLLGLSLCGSLSVAGLFVALTGTGDQGMIFPPLPLPLATIVYGMGGLVTGALCLVLILQAYEEVVDPRRTAPTRDDVLAEATVVGRSSRHDVARSREGPDIRVAGPPTSAGDRAPDETESYGAPPPGRDLTLSYVAVKRDGAVETGSEDEGPLQFAPGVVLQNRYRLDEELGRGGFGVVFLAQDLRLGRAVAVKVIRPDRSSRRAVDQAELEALFEEEARLGASLGHPSIATVHDYGFHEQRPYMVFEYVPGESLRERLERGRIPLDEVLRFLAPVAEALDYAHGRRVVHRDLKPENLRGTDRGEFKVLDLGLARRFDRTDDWRFAGTPAYASPEQAAERPVDGRTDQYALAVIVYEMLTGRRPFLGRDPLELLRRHQFQPVPHPRQFAPELSERTAAALLRALGKDPDERFPSCTDLAAAMGCAVTSREGVEREVLLEAGVDVRPSPLLPSLGAAHLLLTAGSLWSLFRGEVREVPVAAVAAVRRRRGGRTLKVRFRVAGRRPEVWRYAFADGEECQAWHDRLGELASAARSDRAGAVAQRAGRPVALLASRSGVVYQSLGQVEGSGASLQACEAALQIRAAMLGADAVIAEPREARYSERTRKTLEGVRRFRDRVPLPSRALRWAVNRLSRMAGGAGPDERAREQLSGIAVRAASRPDRLKLWGKELRGDVARIGARMLLLVLGSALVGFPPTIVESLRIISIRTRVWYGFSSSLMVRPLARVLRYAGAFLVEEFVPLAQAALAGFWPLILALALFRRRSGRLLAPASITLAGWGLIRQRFALRRIAAGDLGDLAGGSWSLQTVFVCLLVVVAFQAWRAGQRYRLVVRALAPGSDAPPERLGRREWVLTALFLWTVAWWPLSFTTGAFLTRGFVPAPALTRPGTRPAAAGRTALLPRSTDRVFSRTPAKPFHSGTSVSK